jgi:DNA-binding NarL/FixJ family response regulator
MVVDDQALIREGLITLLDAAPGVEPVADAADGERAVTLCARLRPDVVLMDLRMPGLDGVQATRQIRSAQPDTEVVVLTTHADETSILDALHAGARGYLTKDAGIAEIARAVQAAAAHHSTLDPIVHDRLLAAAAAGTPPAPTAGASLPDELTTREAEVLSLIARGLSNEEIATTLVLSQATVKTHINHVFFKTRARDRAQAVHYAYTHGLAGSTPRLARQERACASLRSNPSVLSAAAARCRLPRCAAPGAICPAGSHAAGSGTYLANKAPNESRASADPP